MCSVSKYNWIWHQFMIFWYRNKVIANLISQQKSTLWNHDITTYNRFLMCHRIQFLVKSLKNWKVRLIRLYLYKTSMHSSIKCWKWNGKKSSLEKAKNVQKRHFSWNWIRWRRTDRYWFIILILSSIKDDDKGISFIVICKFALQKQSQLGKD